MAKGEFISPNIHEIRMVMDRMRRDVDIPSMGGAGNKFAGILQRQLQLDDPRHVPDDVTGSLLGRGDILVAWKMPELLMVYHKDTKQDVIPNSPGDFFSSLAQAKYGSFRFGELNREDMNAPQQFFDRATEALDGRIPSLWLSVETLDVLLRGLGLSEPSRMARVLRGWENTQLPKAVTEALTVSLLLALTMRAYFHPGTRDLLGELIREEDSTLLSNGIDLPSTLDNLME